MTIAARCQCGQRFAVKDELAGKKGKCPKCGTIFRIPETPASTEPSASNPPAAPPPPPPRPWDNTTPIPPATLSSAAEPDAFENLGSLFDEEGIGVAGSVPVAPGQGKLCPGCRKVVPAHTLLCVECGWNFEEERRIETKRGPAKRPNDNPYGVSDNYFDEEDDLYTGRSRRFKKDSGNRRGPAWETDDSLVTKYFQTVIDILLSPAFAFGGMRLNGGFGPPITFVLVGYVITYILIAMLILGFISLLGIMPLTGQQIPPGAMAAMGAFVLLGMCCGIAGMLIVAGIILPILMLLSAAILHLFLMCVGGARQNLEATFRAAGYVSGALVLPAVLLGLIPFVGQFISLGIQWVYTLIAVKQTHETSWWQATLATFLWGLVIVGIVIAIQLGSQELFLEQIRARNARHGIH